MVLWIIFHSVKSMDLTRDLINNGYYMFEM